MEVINNWPQAVAVVGCAFCLAMVLCALIWRMP